MVLLLQSSSTDMSSNNRRYDIFISYNKADIEFVERIVKRIEAEKYNHEHLRCFYAAWDIEAGENILLRIEEALSSSRFIGLIVSPDWLKSDWTTLERVIPVYQDPVGIKGRILPILRRNCAIPPTIRILKWLDFRNDSNFEREVRKLVARLKGETFRTLLKHDDTGNVVYTQSFESTKPEPQEELISSNLFQVVQMPAFVNVAQARVRKRDEVWNMLGDVSLPIFAIREDSQRIFAFSELDNPQQKIIQIVQGSSTDRVPMATIISSNLSSVVIELMNRAMTEHMKNIGMVYDWRNKKTFYPLEKDGDESRYAKWIVGSREYLRFVVKRAKSGRYYAHRSCKATFTQLGNHLFLKVLPGWHFTYDGLSEAVSPDMMKSLSSRWMNLQRNPSVLDDIRFWLYKLSGGKDKIEIRTGGSALIAVSAIPLSVNVNQGIEGDYRERLWQEEEPGPDETESVLADEIGELEETEEYDEGDYE